jgi:hypothetical protein
MIFGPLPTHEIHPPKPGPKTGALCAMLAMQLTGCGVEPDEIDLVDGGTGGQTDTGSAGDGDGDAGDGDGDTGDGDGDTSPGDGDGDTGDGDGDGDGDASGDGDGDGDAGDGDGDGDGEGPCDAFEPEAVTDGQNVVAILDGPSQLMASCGAAGPEAVFSYTASADGIVRFEVISSDSDLALYVVTSCDPLEEIACATEPDPMLIDQLMTQGMTYYIVLDSVVVAGGDAVLEITPP